MPAESRSQTSINLGDQDNSHFRVQLWTSGGHLKWEFDIRNGNSLFALLSVLKFRVIFRPSELQRCSLSHVVSSGFCLRFVSFLPHAKLGEPVIPKRMSHERCVAILRRLL